MSNRPDEQDRDGMAEIEAMYGGTPTPGPWHRADNELMVYAVRPDGNEPAVAITGKYDGYPSWVLVEGEAEANARLIAASPTMYEYIQRKASEGDENAAQIIKSIYR